MKYKISSLEDIFDGFEGVTDQEWRERIEKDVKGGFQDLLWQDENKMVFQPYYRRPDLIELKQLKKIQSANKLDPDWEITQLLEYSPEDEKTSLGSLKKAMESGAGSILLKNNSTTVKLEEFLKSNLLDHSSIMVEQNTENLEAMPQQLKNTLFLLDPIGDSMTKGNQIELPNSFSEKNRRGFFDKENLKLLIDGSSYKNAGSNQVQELSYMLQHAVEYFDFFTEQGLNAQTIANKMVLKVGIGTSFFPEIAKVRALRFLWNKLLSAYQVQTELVIIAESSSYYLSVIEPYNNLLRETTQMMSAAFANCNFITSPSFDLNNSTNPDFSQRMARNIQIILKEESYAHKVQDPSAGSYYIETITEKFAEAAWEKFLKIEDSGGLKPVYESGEMQEAIKIVHEQRLEDMKVEAAQPELSRRKMMGINIHKDESLEKANLKVDIEGESPFVPLKARNLSKSYLRKEEGK